MANILFNNIVLEPAVELTPFISIAALNRQELCVDLLDETPRVDIYFSKRFGDNYTFCPKAREGIVIVLKELNLQPNDVVTILTTTGSPYISGCVTKAIEQVCKWSREVLPATKVLFVNHEFGYSYEDVASLKKYKLPIIEDCAHSFFTDSPDIGLVGDFVIYSLPKPFSIQMGGIIKYKNRLSYNCPEGIVRYLKSALEPQVDSIEQIIKKRFDNYGYYLEQLKELGVVPFFKLKQGDVPGVFMFTWPRCKDYRKLKSLMNDNGVDSSVFFGNDAYFVPIHQNVTKKEIDYICNIIRYFDNVN